MKINFVLLMGLVLAAGLCWGQDADDGFNPDANGSVYAIIVQPDGKILLGGAFDTLGGVERSGIARVLVNGQLDTAFDPGDGAESDVVNALALQADGKVIVGGDFDAFAHEGRNHIARLNSDGSLDAAFNPGANGEVEVLAVQPDGKIIVGGNFANLGGHIRTFIGRLNADGSLDTSFNVTADDTVYAMAVQSNGKIVVGGKFTLMGSENHRGIARLNADGSVDPTFGVTNINNTVHTLALQADGKIIVGGTFTQVNGQDRNHIARLNVNGDLETFHPDVNSTVYEATLQPDGKIIIGGAFTQIGLTDCIKIGRLNSDGTLDTGFESPGGAINTVFTLAVQTDNSVLAGGTFHKIGGVDRDRIARLYPDGRTDANFMDQDADPTLGVSDAIYALAQQPDWRLLAGGLFLDISGSARMRLARLEIDGTLDTLNPLPDASLRSIVVQSDGKILIGGFFTHLDATEYKYIARLDTANNPEADFHPDPNDTVRCILPLTNGQIIVAGEFTQIGITDCIRIGRLNSDGTLDDTFAVPGGADAIIYSALLQPDGKIVVAGEFTHLGGVERNRIGRLNSDGSLDAAFDPNVNNGRVYSLALQADGKIMLGGTFTAIGADSAECRRIGRLNADGTLDTSFAVPGGVNQSVRSIAIQTDGKIIIVGAFTTIGELNRPCIVRLNSDGSLDTDYDISPGANDTIHSLVLQPDGKAVVGGEFTLLTRDRRCRLGRLSASAAAIQNLAANSDGTAVTWTRTGSAPEVDSVIFHQSMDGATWTSLGAGTRVTNGWQIAGLSLPLNTNSYLRARGFYRCGYFNNSISLCESIRLFYLTPPTVVITNLTAESTATVDSTSCILSGTANTNTVGTMWWTNSLGTSGTFTASSAWSVTHVALRAGTNTLTVYGSNILGVVANDAVNVIVHWSTPVAADFDGDRLADPAAFIGTNLYAWLSTLNYSRLGPLTYGVAGATGLAADFDGDGLADPAAYLGVNWYAWLSTADYAAGGPYAYGIEGALPVAADFDGDGIGDVAVYAGTEWTAWLSGSWYAEVGPYSYGIAGALPVAADFDGDGRADPAVYSGTDWTAWLSAFGYAQVGPYTYGFAGAVPIAADFDGDGIGDVAVSYNRQWYAWLSSVGYAQVGPYAFNLQE